MLGQDSGKRSLECDHSTRAPLYDAFFTADKVVSKTNKNKICFIKQEIYKKTNLEASYIANGMQLLT